jgi:radical SAM-linked protein
VADTTFRLRVTYGKTGRLRFLSHLEVARACERSVRRAGLEYAVTQGFNPRMKLAFGPALPVGTAGLAEVYDVWLKRFVAPGEVLDRLRASTPEGLSPVRARYAGEREASVAAALTLADYEVEFGHPDRGPGRLAEAIGDVVSSGVLEMEHKGALKVYDLAVCLPEGVRVREENGRSIASLTVRMGAQGSLRPDALLREALRRAGMDDESMSVTRTGLRLEVARA